MNTSVYYEDSNVTLLLGDAHQTLTELPETSVHCVVTSPPYYRARDYQTEGQYGHEDSSCNYVENLQKVFAETRRVLRDDGTLWLNLGDGYTSATETHASRTRNRGLPAKNLRGVPWRVAFALQYDGWILRNAIVWHKPNACPESVQDRLSTRHELIFLLVKQPRYYFDLDAVRVPLQRPEVLQENITIGGSRKGNKAGIDATRRRRGNNTYGNGKYDTNNTKELCKVPGRNMRPGSRHISRHPRGRNPGDVWSINTRPYRDAHFSTYPIDIPLRCIAAGCPPQGAVLDPFSGAGTTGLAARTLDRTYLGIELNPDYHELALNRITRFFPPPKANQ